MSFLSGLLTHFKGELERNRTRPFLCAAMAGAALVATADGDVSFGERIRLDQILETLELDLSRICAAPLTPYYAQKENDYGNKTYS